MKNKIILDLCGGTGAWSKPYKDAGYDVRLVTLPDYKVQRVDFDVHHGCHQPDIFTFQGKTDLMNIIANNVYGILAAPPCDQFSFAKTTGARRDLEKGMKVVYSCLKIIWYCQSILLNYSLYAKRTSLKFWALENPNGLLKHFLGKPAFEFNPYDFGDNYKKKTHLWGWFNEPKKEPIKCNKPKFDKLLTREIAPEHYGKLTRQERRAITPSGFAKAFFKANK